MGGIHIGAISLAALIVLVPFAFVWYVTGGSVYQAFKMARQRGRQSLMCSIDSDCPSGHVCIGGNCVPA